jgi:hypothetical protein
MHTKKTTLETYVRKKGYGCTSGGNEEAPAESCAPHESTARNTASLERKQSQILGLSGSQIEGPINVLKSGPNGQNPKL